MWVVTLYVIINVVAFILVMLDKGYARKGKRRVRERTFFLCSFFFGAVGVLIGMRVFRHKTLHVTFVIGIPVLVVLNLCCMYYLWQLVSGTQIGKMILAT